MFLMYVSETTLGPRMMTPAAEATNARKSVALCDVIEQEDTTAARFSAACLTSHRIG
jgi:hydroxyacyl-ACP dehydratase HTD2-like protein with hotdog domain